MKKFLLIMLLVVVAAKNVNAAETPSIYGYGAVKSSYVLGNALEMSDKPVIQGGVTFSWKSGLYLDIWGSRPFKKQYSTDFGNEIDLTLGWKGPLLGFRADAGVAHYNLYPVSRLEGNDIWGAYIELTPSEPSIFYSFVRLETIHSTSRNVSFAKQIDVGVRYHMPLRNMKLHHEARASFRESFPGVGGGTIFSYKASLEVPISKEFTVSPFYERRQPLHLDGGRVPHNIVGIGFGVSF